MSLQPSPTAEGKGRGRNATRGHQSEPRCWGAVTMAGERVMGCCSNTKSDGAWGSKPFSVGPSKRHNAVRLGGGWGGRGGGAADGQPHQIRWAGGSGRPGLRMSLLRLRHPAEAPAVGASVVSRRRPRAETRPLPRRKSGPSSDVESAHRGAPSHPRSEGARACERACGVPCNLRVAKEGAKEGSLRCQIETLFISGLE